MTLQGSGPVSAPQRACAAAGSRHRPPCMPPATLGWGRRSQPRNPPPLSRRRRRTGRCCTQCTPPCLRSAGTFPPRSPRMAWPGWSTTAPRRTVSLLCFAPGKRSPPCTVSVSWRRRCTTNRRRRAAAVSIPPGNTRHSCTLLWSWRSHTQSPRGSGPVFAPERACAAEGSRHRRLYMPPATMASGRRNQPRSPPPLSSRHRKICRRRICCTSRGPSPP